MYVALYMRNKVQKVLKVKPIPTPLGADHPEPPNDILPKHEFTLGLIAPKGSGKTTLICNLLWFYRKYFHNILVFSPTILSDEKWDWIKEQELIGENKALKNWIKDLSQKYDDNAVVQPAPPGRELEGLVNQKPSTDGRIPEDCFFTEYNESVLAEIMEEQMKVVKLLKKHDMTKHLANRILIVFDDLVGSSLFSGRKDNPFKKLNTNHRHYSISILMVTQAYKEIPKTVRTQYTGIMIFEIPNEKELEVIYEENPVGLNYDDWMSVYKYCTAGDFDFMYLNFKKEKRLRIMKNFDEYVFTKNE